MAPFCDSLKAARYITITDAEQIRVFLILPFKNTQELRWNSIEIPVGGINRTNYVITLGAIVKVVEHVRFSK
jgi:hypothetical protein